MLFTKTLHVHSRKNIEKPRRVFLDRKNVANFSKMEQFSVVCPPIIYRTEQEKYAAMADEIEQIHRWDTLTFTNGTVIIGEITGETTENVQFQKKGTKETETIAQEKIRSLHKKGRPILVGTVSIEKSERLGSLLSKRGVKHEVLNAKQHKREADIVAQAGRTGAVTIATNMAGRGTDIVLGGNPETMAWALG